MAFSLEYVVTEGLRVAVEQALGEEIAEALKRFEARRAEIISATAMKVSSQMNFETIGQTLRIEIKEVK